MADTIIPVTYPGHPDYALIFRMHGASLFVRWSWPDAVWKPVLEVSGVLNEHDQNDVAVTINGDLRAGMPFYVHMDPTSFQRVRRLIGLAGNRSPIGR